MSTTAELTELKAQRASTKGCITRIKNIIESKGQSLSEAELECRLGILESYFKQLLTYQLAIEKLSPNDANEQKLRGELEDLYCATKSNLLTLLNGRRRSGSLPAEHSITIPSVAINHLPKLRLPHFTGKYSEFPNFIGSFETLVDKNGTLSEIEKFNHLLSCLSGPALNTIKALEVTGNNYTKALESLKKRYDNKYIIFQEHIIDLFNLPKVSKNSANQLRSLIDSTNAHLSSLLSLGSHEDIVNAMLIHLVNSKLDFESQCKWEDKMDTTKLPSWEECANILNRRCLYLESRDARVLCDSPSSSTSRQLDKHKPRRGGNNLTSLTVAQTICLFCKQNGHLIYKCPEFLKLPVLARFTEAKQQALCINCLSKNHSVKKCKAQKCRVCQMPHHTLLHRYKVNSQPSHHSDCNVESSHNVTDQSTVQANSSNLAHKSSLPLSLLSSNNPQNKVLLATAVVKIRDKFGQYHLARALLDSASQLNFISESLAQSLKLKREQVDMRIHGIANMPTRVRGLTQTVIKSRINDFEISLPMYVLPHITGAQPERKIDIVNWAIPKNIQLADPLFHQPQKIELLIGADVFFDLLSVGQIKLEENLPSLQKTLFGWIVSGKYFALSSPTPSCNISNSGELHTSDGNQTLSEIVERFWQEETIDSVEEKPKLTAEQECCEAEFKRNVRRLSNGRFMVKLPFHEPPESQLLNSFENAHRRFISLERKLLKDPELKAKYSEFLKEYLSADHMELISSNNIPKAHYFMPHRCVLRPDSSTTKLRVVFDASCRTSTNKSLNDLLMVGPIVQDDLFSILNRFRWHKYALTADVAAMYRQILVYPEDSNYQLILWRDNTNEQLKVFRLKTVTYGTASAPYLATRCLLQLAEDNQSKFPNAARIVKTDFYMDDLLTGADTQEELYQLREQIDEILKSGQFTLRKWYSNDVQLLSKIPESDREKTLMIDGSDVIKTLGLIWYPALDEFWFHHNPASINRTITKRRILSEMARVFDPLGLINPVVVRAKMFMQELWCIKLDWDESLPQAMENRWRKFMEDLNYLKDIHIPRQVLLAGEILNIEIHGFADASTRAYGCCVYVVSTFSDGNISVNLLAAKSRVAPIKTIRSLPCLELCAALLLARLVTKLRSSIPRPFNATHLWTDSEIVLNWLASHPSEWKTYVANRVSEIQNLTLNCEWKHVPSKANPADIISRGITAFDLPKSIWLYGPDFLWQTRDKWPPLKEKRYNKENLPERRKIVSVLTCSTTGCFIDTIYNMSDFMKNLRRFAFVVRFAKILLAKCKNQSYVTQELTATEIDDAFMRIVWAIQQQQFKPEIDALERDEKLPGSSKIIKLTPFMENSLGFNLLRVGGRLKHSDLPYDQKFPILLPGNNDFVKSYMYYLHLKNFHAGPQALISLVQQRFWIVNVRDYARRTVRSCIHCIRYRPRLAQQIMGDLPSGRVNLSLPFTHSGVDFCGPISTTHKLRGKAIYKSYIAIFVCFATKAVHIEVVSDLTSDAFIAALKRFVGRRNLCRHLYCDNATNFMGARRQLQEFRDAFLQERTQEDIQRWCANNTIDFHPIPPRSPHFGGIWEAAVKSAKNHLYKTIKDTLLTYEELNTVMVQIEAVLNSRPITPMSTDPNDEQALTPAHFLNQAPVNCLIEPTIPIKNFNYIRRWQRITALQQHFWQRWSKEYLIQLQERAKWRTSYPNLVENTLVLVHQDDAPPYKWKLGRVIRTTKGSDGKVRVVDIKTATGVIQRAIHKVAPIPHDDD